MRVFPYACKKNDDLQFIASRMSISSLEFLPVVDENDCVIGTITFESLCKAIKQNNLADRALKIGDIMNEDPILIHSYDDEALAYKKMRAYQLNYLPVVDDNSHLRGVVSFMTVARRIVGLKKSISGRSSSLLSEGFDLSYN